jgi:hypothetical protein
MNELLIQIKKKQVKELESLSVGRNGNLLDHHPYNMMDYTYKQTIHNSTT